MHDVHAGGHLPKRGIGVGKVLAFASRHDKELASSCVRSTGVGHGNGTDRVLRRGLGRILIGNGVARATHAGTGWVTRLIHKVRNDAVENNAVVVAVLSEEDEVVRRYRRALGIERDGEGTKVGVDQCGIDLCRVDGHRWG